MYKKVGIGLIILALLLGVLIGAFFPIENPILALILATAIAVSIWMTFYCFLRHYKNKLKKLESRTAYPCKHCGHSVLYFGHRNIGVGREVRKYHSNRIHPMMQEKCRCGCESPERYSDWKTNPYHKKLENIRDLSVST